jgi:O-succinylbenzoate synthase
VKVVVGLNGTVITCSGLHGLSAWPMVAKDHVVLQCNPFVPGTKVQQTRHRLLRAVQSGLSLNFMLNLHSIPPLHVRGAHTRALCGRVCTCMCARVNMSTCVFVSVCMHACV